MTPATKPHPSVLTRRESDIALLVAQGLPNKLVARRLNVAEGTVKVHLHKVYQKLGISNRTELAAIFQPAAEPTPLTAQAANDFNNLLAVIVGSAELLAENQPNARSEFAAMLRDAAEQGALLTRRLAGQTQAPPPVGEGSEPLSRGERILLVEDQPRIRLVISSQLRRLGYVVEEAESAELALALLHTPGKRFDLLFSDVVLPGGMSGVELVRRARALAPSLKVLLMSGFAQEIFDAEGLPEGDVLLLNKPFQRAQLAQALNTTLGERQKR